MRNIPKIDVLFEQYIPWIDLNGLLPRQSVKNYSYYYNDKILLVVAAVELIVLVGSVHPVGTKVLRRLGCFGQGKAPPPPPWLVLFSIGTV